MNAAAKINLSLESFKGILGKSVQYFLGFIGTVLFARVLGPTSFGGFYTLMSLVFLVQQPLIGVSNAVEKRLTETDAPRGEILGSSLIAHGVAYAILAVALWLTGGALEARTNVDDAGLVFFLLILSTTVFIAYAHLLSGSGRPALQIWSDTLRSVFTFPLQLLFVLFGFGAAGMGYGLAAASFLTVPIAAYFVKTPLEIPSREVARSLWRYARYSMPGALVATTYTRLDILLIGFFLTTGAAGQYETAYKLTTPAILVSSAIGPAIFPKISSLHSRGEPIGDDISNTLAFTSVLAIPIFFGALAIPESLVVTVYGGKYRDAAVLLIGLALYQLIHTQTNMFTRTIDGIDEPRTNLLLNVFTLSVNIVLGVALLFKYGPLGVVVATVVSEATRYAICVVVVRRRLRDVTVLPRPLVEQFIAGAVMYGVVEAVTGGYSIRNWVDLIVVLLVGSLAYGAALLAISQGLRATVRSVFRDARR